MRVTPQEYQQSITLLREYASTPQRVKRYKVRKCKYSKLPTRTEPVFYRPEDVFTIEFDSEDTIVSIAFNGSNVECKWSNDKLHDWITNTLQRIP